jgi:hypothetical protein
MGLNGDVAGGVSHAGQHKTIGGLPVVQEALVALVNGAGSDLASAARAGTCSRAVEGTRNKSQTVSDAYSQHSRQ